MPNCGVLPLGLVCNLFLGMACLCAQTPSSPESSAAQANDTNTRLGDDHPNPAEDSRDRIYYPGDTERPGPLARKLWGNILLDQKQIFTSPFRMKRSDAKWWIGFGAAAAALIATDRTTSTALENSKGQIRWANHVSQIGASYTLIPLTAGFYAYGVIADDPKPREVGVLGAEAMLDSLIVVSILKPIAGRNRPDAAHERGNFFDGGSGFPSGHAIESWALASLIAHEYQHQIAVPILAYGLAGVVSAARFGAQRHYASDIVVGGAMGWFIGRYVYKTHMDHAIHKHGWLRPQVTPFANPSDRTFGVALNFGN